MIPGVFPGRVRRAYARQALVRRQRRNTPPIPEADQGIVLRLPLAAMLKMVQNLLLNGAQNPVRVFMLPEAEEDGQAFKKTETVFIAGNTRSQQLDEFLVERIGLRYARVKIRHIFYCLLYTSPSPRDA